MWWIGEEANKPRIPLKHPVFFNELGLTLRWLFAHGFVLEVLVMLIVALIIWVSFRWVYVTWSFVEVFVGISQPQGWAPISPVTKNHGVLFVTSISTVLFQTPCDFWPFSLGFALPNRPSRESLQIHHEEVYPNILPLEDVFPIEMVPLWGAFVSFPGGCRFQTFPSPELQRLELENHLLEKENNLQNNNFWFRTNWPFYPRSLKVTFPTFFCSGHVNSLTIPKVGHVNSQKNARGVNFGETSCKIAVFLWTPQLNHLQLPRGRVWRYICRHDCLIF